MKVSEAVLSRKTTRAFLKKPVRNELIKSLLKKSSRAASGGNLQPWRVFVINNETMKSFLDFQKNWTDQEVPSYAVYPENLKEPYRSSRYKVGEDLYALLGISREDKEGRYKQLSKNFEFFGAPAAFFCFVDRQMGPPQWSDLGMFLQTFMLLAREEGLDTCPQEAWAMKPQSVSKFVEADEELMLFCGMAIGYKDEKAKINDLITEREPLDVWVKFIEK
tara:strand:- start:8884 stop:9543 length:660 start_codon:yes stop_codon:yes gene_type:complete